MPLRTLRTLRSKPAMFKKIAIGILAVAVVLGVARAGYEFGRHLAHKDNAKTQPAAVAVP